MLSFVKTHKQQIAETFGKAAQHYDNYAEIQRYSGYKLMELAKGHQGKYLLDAGCGTGYFSQQWKQQGKYVVALDLSAQMLQVAQHQSRANSYIQSDIEHCALMPNSMDMVFSNLAIQWCDDLPTAIHALMTPLRQNGALYFSTLASSTLQEVRNAWQSVDLHSHVNPFLSLQEIEQACSGYQASISSEIVTEHYDSLSGLFDSLKGVGANYLQGGRQKGLMTRQKFRALEDVWQKQSDQYLLSYQLVTGVVRHG